MHSELSRTKNHAKLLTARLSEMGLVISHGQSLEGVAAIAGHRSWHAYIASLPKTLIGAEDTQSVNPESKFKVESSLIQAFRAALLGLCFQNNDAAGAKKQSIAGFHLGGGLVVLFEHKLREKCMEQLSLEARATLGGVYPNQTRLGDFSTALLSSLHAEGWLVTEWGKWTGSREPGKVDSRLWAASLTDERWSLPVNEAVWDIVCNGYTYLCMVIVRLPLELQATLPGPTKYRIIVTEPHFEKHRQPAVA